MSEANLKPVRVSIRQFQSIDALDMEVRGFTCVTGKTNIGKSAILRAVSSAILNGSVNGMIRSGSKFTSVELQSEAWGFKWEKGPGVSRYHVAGTTYDKVGQSEFAMVTGMGFGAVKLGAREVYPWWASQFEPIFLLGATGGAVTDFVSDISRLAVLQDAIVLSGRGKKRSTDEAKRSSEQAAELRSKASKVEAVDHLAQVERDLVEQEASIREYRRRISAGESVQLRVRRAGEAAALLAACASVRTPQDRAGEELEKVRRASAAWSRLRACAGSIISIRDVAKVSVPEDVPEVEDLRRASRHARVPGLRASVDSMSRAPSVPSSGPSDEEVSSLSRASGHRTRMERLASSLRAMRSAPPIPEEPATADELGRLRRAADASRRMSSASTDVERLSADSARIAGEIAELDRQIAAIPSCPSCGRVVAGPEAAKHQHEVARA